MFTYNLHFNVTVAHKIYCCYYSNNTHRNKSYIHYNNKEELELSPRLVRVLKIVQ
jgi:hypothetical protein